MIGDTHKQRLWPLLLHDTGISFYLDGFLWGRSVPGECMLCPGSLEAALEALQAQMPLAAGAMMPEPREDLQRLALRVTR